MNIIRKTRPIKKGDIVEYGKGKYDHQIIERPYAKHSFYIKFFDGNISSFFFM
jgi:hypothetical protein